MASFSFFTTEATVGEESPPRAASESIIGSPEDTSHTLRTMHMEHALSPTDIKRDTLYLLHERSTKQLATPNHLHVRKHGTVLCNTGACTYKAEDRCHCYMHPQSSTSNNGLHSRLNTVHNIGSQTLEVNGVILVLHHRSNSG